VTCGVPVLPVVGLWCSAGYEFESDQIWIRILIPKDSVQQMIRILKLGSGSGINNQSCQNRKTSNKMLSKIRNQRTAMLLIKLCPIYSCPLFLYYLLTLLLLVASYITFHALYGFFFSKKRTYFLDFDISLALGVLV
jgi:hypothetical protein